MYGNRRIIGPRHTGVNIGQRKMEKSDFSKTRNLGLQTIATKYMPATDTKGERIKAKASGGESHIHAWDYALSQARNYDVAYLAHAIPALDKEIEKWKK